MAKPIGYGGRDYPDFGVSNTAGRIVQLTDLSELAVRLGSLCQFDRLGNVLMQEGFQRGLVNWENDSYPAGAIAVPSARFYSVVPYSARLTTTDDLASYCSIIRSFPIPYIAQFGVEVHFKALAAFSRFRVVLDFYNGDNHYWIIVCINWASQRLELYNSSTQYVKVDDLLIDVGASSAFHVIKLTVNLTTEKFVRLILNGRNYDVSAIPIRKTESEISPHLHMQLLLNPVTTTVNYMWVDNIIFTTDEPTV